VHFTSGEVVYRDGVQTTLKVRYPAPLLRHVETRRVEGDIANMLAGVDPQLLEGKGTVRVSFTNSRAIELQEALDQLLHYPYGCVEQTTSSTLPWLTLNRLRSVLPFASAQRRRNRHIDPARRHTSAEHADRQRRARVLARAISIRCFGAAPTVRSP
jgi:uncharacterized protein YfaS (alpha-2-macroglobulin family)